MNIISHVRSVFLQGLLLSGIKKFFYYKYFQEVYKKYDKNFLLIKKSFLAIQSVINDIQASIVIGRKYKQVKDIINAYFIKIVKKMI